MATPMSASTLVRILEAEGCRVEQVRDWRDHNRNHRGAWGPLNGLIVHHTVTSGTAGTVDLCYDGYSGLPGPLCHGVIAKDGTVHLVGWGRANHAGGGDPRVLDRVIAEDYGDQPPAPTRGNSTGVDGNARFIGWECINRGDGDDPWPDAQLEAIERACAAVCRHYGWSAKSVIGHKEWSNDKIDPRGFSMTWMRDRIQNRLDGRPQNQQEDDMPTAQEIAKAVAEYDGYAVPWESGNKNNQLRYAFASVWRIVYRTEAKVEAQGAVLRELAAALASRDQAVDVEALIARIEAAIENIDVRLDATTPEGN